ncbi:MAG: indole-3-glycerol phosphate synthase TrpC [Candidatus Glassbacteria bacterium]|nr:indole-3-glycerol phosphate synthase TrpC [Candidatus Glassbacteria bacterium]
MNVLERIILDKREELADQMRRHPLESLKGRMRDEPLPERFDFASAVSGKKPAALIAEIKKASPSKGLIRQDFEPETLAASYAEGGADALSVLTETQYFLGHPEDISLAKCGGRNLPVLRKDFIVDPWQVYESRLLGADCILLIAAVLETSRLADLHALAAEVGLDVLVEVHNEAELEAAEQVHSKIIGVNNRDLATFEVTLEVSERLTGRFPEGTIKVSESGIHGYPHMMRVVKAGYDAVLVGEYMLRRDDVAAAARKLMGRDR